LHLFVCFLLCGSALMPARAAEMGAGTTEISGVAGLATRLGGTKLGAGGTVGKALTEKLFLVGDMSYIPLGDYDSGPFGVQSSGRLFGINGGIQYHFAGTETLSPFVTGGLGIWRSSASASGSFGGVDFNQSAASTDLFLNFGGGVRYYVSKRWGVRPELIISTGNGTFLRLGMGVFYQFGK
jgi:hypothetical protein